MVDFTKDLTRTKSASGLHQGYGVPQFKGQVASLSCTPPNRIEFLLSTVLTNMSSLCGVPFSGDEFPRGERDVLGMGHPT
jgi:hypothetical protein